MTRDLSPKKDAFPYQLDAIEQIRGLEYSAVFHEQGLGKTKIAIDVILYWLATRELDCVIVVAKKGLVPNWISEFNDHTHLRPSVLGSNSSENYYTLTGNAVVIVAHYEAIKKEKSRLKLFCEGIKVGIVLDEAHKIKNPKSGVTEAFLELRESFKKRLILTGTPAANRPYDLWSQIYFLDGGAALGQEFDEFQKETDIDFVPEGGDRREYETNLAVISEKLKGFMVRETKDGDVIDLPDKRYQKIEAAWEPLQRDKYIQARDELSVIVVQEGEAIADNSEPILKRLIRLVQLASNPGLIDEAYVASPGKLEPLTNLVGEIIDRGEKAIVWSSFNDNMKLLRDNLAEYGCRTVYGKMSVEERYLSIDSFKNDPKVRVLVATPGAAKEGLTLTVANNVIYFDRTFSLDDYLQSQDRIHRISQERECNIYTLYIPGSIDEWVDELLTAKVIAAKFSQGDIEAEEFRETMNFTFRESLREALGIDD